MTGALQLLARLSHAPVPPVPSVPPTKQERQAARVHTAATASIEWLAARDAYLAHLMTCPNCYAPTARHCPTGVHLRQCYDGIPLEVST